MKKTFSFFYWILFGNIPNKYKSEYFIYYYQTIKKQSFKPLAKILQDMWILTETGIAIFQRVYDAKLDEQLFAMLMSALNSFAEEISKGGLSNFELSNRRFSIIKRSTFLFIASSSPKIKGKKVISELEIIADKFFDQYPQDLLDNWDSDIDTFKDFGNIVEESVEKKVQSFLDNI